MYKKIGLLVCLLLTSVLITSCGGHKEANADISSLEYSCTLPEALGGKTTLEDVSEEVFAQQVSACEAYYEAYQITDVGKFTDKYPDVPTSRLIESLSNKRQEINSEISEKFIENMTVILKDVTDCKNKERYINNCLDDARLFANDYHRIVTATAADFVKINNILVNYAQSDNEFAIQVLKNHSDLVIETALLDIEHNAEAEESFRANITKNNDTIEAVNNIYGGFGGGKENKRRVNDASMKLLKKLLDSVETMTEYERRDVIKQLEEIQNDEEAL